MLYLCLMIKSIPKILLLTSILCIVSAHLCSAIWSYRESLHLRCTDCKPTSAQSLPFNIRLQSFNVIYASNGISKADYRSKFILFDSNEVIYGQVSMNKVFKYKNYRICQQGYDSDLQGCTLLVTHDPYGVFFIFLGYLLLSISILWLLLQRDGAFRKLLRQLSLSLLLTTSFLIPLNTSAQTPSSLTNASSAHAYLSPDEADAFSHLAICYEGRIAPFESYAIAYCNATQYNSGKKRNGLSPSAFVLDVYLYPHLYSNLPQPQLRIFPQGNAWLCPSDTCNSSDSLFTAHILDLLQLSVNENDKSQTQQIIHAIERFQQQRSFPGAINQQKMNSELLYIHLNPPFFIIITLFLCFLSSLSFIFFMKNNKPLSIRILQIIPSIPTVLILTDFFWRSSLIGHLAFRNTYDTLILLSFFLLIISYFFVKRIKIIHPVTIGLSAFIFLSASLIYGVSFSPINPVLSSPLLGIHVALIMSAYALFLLCFIISVIYFIYKIKLNINNNNILLLSTFSRIFHILAVVLLCFGIMLGSVWANISWGSYWSWDPKESTALMTLLIYCCALPSFNGRFNNGTTVFHLIQIIAFCSLLLTYFGVNIFFGGLHAYSN